MAIIGHGDIASVLPDEETKLFFASGVSNSQETRESEYRREVELLLSQDIGAHLVYFSSLCVFYSDTRYAQHKRYMEQLVKGFHRYTIVRLGNITWGTNPHTLINYFRLQVARGETPQVHNVYRYVIELPEFLYWVNLIPQWSCEMNLPGRRMKVKEVYEEYVKNIHHHP